MLAGVNATRPARPVVVAVAVPTPPPDLPHPTPGSSAHAHEPGVGEQSIKRLLVV